MPASVRTCPSCKSLLLKETPECPECGHVLDSRRTTAQAPPANRARTESAEDDLPCPACGELVKPGLVRCWNCGSFMREDIAAKYQQMQKSPSPVIYSAPDDGSPVYQFEESSGGGEGEDDFELSADVAAQLQERRTDEEFETSPEFAPREADIPADSEGGAATYTLSGNRQQAAAESGTETTDDGPPAADGSAEQRPDEAGGRGQASDQGDQDQTPPETGPPSESPEQTPHSVATGGDALLQVALQEESETVKRRARPAKKRSVTRPISGFLVYCPNGHRIEVHDRHRGKMGRCPKCRTPFIVPEKTAEELAQEQQLVQQAAGEVGEQSGVVTAGAYTHWMADVPLHTVNPEKLRLKPGSLRNEFQEADCGFSPDGLLVAALASSPGVFGIGGKKKDEARDELLTALREEVPLEDLPVAAKRFYNIEAIHKLSIAQPFLEEHESMFAGVPVFGPGRIAVRFPKTEQSEFPQFASFSLSEFREFGRILEEMYGIENFGAEFGIPLTDSFTEQKCHYSEETFQALEHVEYYQADSAYKLKVAGRKCQACGVVVSEDSRKKEKIGGLSGRAIAKAKCPKCNQKFGDFTFYAIEEGPATQPQATDEQASETSADEQPETETASAESNA